ncbi:MAG: hypothetical protein HY908_18560 [Myxococcales bacterium]|nr:hypothetical protein [Myxococcales bacterium]
MIPDRDPPRLLDESGEPDLLRDALAAGRDDVPSEQALAGLWGRLVTPPVGPGGPGGEGPGGEGPGGAPDGQGPGTSGGPGAGPAATAGSAAAKAAAGAGTGAVTAAGGLTAKVAAVLAGLGLAAVVTWQATRPSTSTTTTTTTTIVATSAPGDGSHASALPSSTAPAVASARPDAEASAVVPSAVPSASGRPGASAGASTSAAATPSAAPSASVEPQPTELELLQQARAALGGDPGRALALTTRAAELYPKGALGQEREMIRIQALAGAGRRAEALAAARAFEASHPGSAYARRLEQLFPELAGP